MRAESQSGPPIKISGSIPTSSARCARTVRSSLHATRSRHLELAEFQIGSAETLVEAVRETVQAVLRPEAFETATDLMRSSVDSQVDLALTLMPMLARLPASVSADFLASIMDQFFKARPLPIRLDERRHCGSRDTRDPEIRWQLEIIGGDIPAEIPKPRARKSRLVRA